MNDLAKKQAAYVASYLNGLRGIAALLVVFSHWRNAFFVDYAQIAHPNPIWAVVYLICGLGHQAVIIFFVLSGYLVGGACLRQVKSQRWSWTNYGLDRLTRLYTVLIPGLILGAIWDGIGLHFFGDSQFYTGNTNIAIIQGSTSEGYNLATFFGNLFFLQGILVKNFGSNNPLWSLSYEFWYYVLFPLLVLPFYTKRMIPRILSLAAALILLMFVGQTIALYAGIWLLGALVYLLSGAGVGEGIVSRVSVPLAAFAFAAILVVIKVFHWNSFLADLSLSIIVAGLIYSVVNFRPKALPKPLAWMADRLAESSYTLYVLHYPLIMLIAAATVQGRWQPGDYLATGKAALILLVILVYARIAYICFEARTSAIRARLKIKSVMTG